jgi:hypothetical protein
MKEMGKISGLYSKTENRLNDNFFPRITNQKLKPLPIVMYTECGKRNPDPPLANF